MSVLPLQIRVSDQPLRLTAAGVPYGVSMVSELDFAFIVEVDDEKVVMTPYEFACYDASCRPPTSGGTGGSKPKGSAGKSTGGEGGAFIGGGPGTLGGGVKRKVGGDQHADDMRQLIASEQKDFANNVMNDDGTLGLPFTKPGGAGTVEFDAKMQKWVDNKLAELGVTHEELVNNLVNDGLNAINSPQAAKAITWYDTENEWGTNLATTYGVDIDRVFAAVSLTSAMRKWGVEGTGTNPSSTNKGAIETILKKLKDDEPFEVTAEMAANFNTFKGDKKGIGEGAQIEPGIYRPSDLSSASIARLATGLGWKILNSAGTKPIAKAIAVIRGELEVNDVVRGTKQRSFVSNLAHPEIDYTSTNDLWHFRAVAGKSEFNFPDRRKNEDGTPVVPGTGTKIRTTLADYESHITGYDKAGKPVRGNAPHDIFTAGPPNSGLYTEITKITREALDTLATRDVRFQGMKIHEFQALVWKFAGGNAGSDTE
jgi:hypothetical protein